MADPRTLADRLRAATIARVGLGRIGSALPTRALLDFDLAHARARDAVLAELPSAWLAERETIAVASRASDRETYLKRPDLGRRLAEGTVLPEGTADLAIVLADGLSATALERHGAAVADAVGARLADWSIAPLVVARQARVALGDEIAVALGAASVVVLIGERPGLSAPDSLGAYISWAPRTGLRDSERNCVSNIRPPAGLGHAEAADRIAFVLRAARAAGRTGVRLELPHAGSVTDQSAAGPV
jgi:ethanolamine ammonia-lyase small subunit